ncbi:MAG: phosphoenolpyruvate--protein phosphotransferase [Gammaproteobacteria bacterium]|nr:phosphoenolpyruvate--protein phosphotransferase [Gammaproteobacteria bacterium]
MTHKIFETLKCLIQDVNEASGLEQALNIIVTRTRQVMHADAVSVYFRDNNTNQLVLMATDGLNPKAIGKIRFDLDQGLVSLVLTQTEPLNIKNAHAHPNYRYVTETDELAFHGFLGVPIIQHRHALGVLVVRQTRQRRFSADDETFLVTLAAQLAGAISHAEKMGELTKLLTDTNHDSFILKGLSGSPGIAIGEAVIVFPPANLDAVPDNVISEHEIDDHIQAFNRALDNVENEFMELSRRLQDSLSREELALFDAFCLMLRSDTLVNTVIDRIKSGQWAQGALRETISEHVSQFNAMDDAYLRERAADIKDLGRRILMHLQAQQSKPLDSTAPVILVGEELSVSQFTEVPMQYLAGIISTQGSASSHIAILSHALGIPAVMGVEDLPVNRLKGQQIVVDGYRGRIYVKPTAAVLNEFKRLIKKDEILDSALKQLIDKSSTTLDGVHIPLHVNTGLLADISPSIQSGAEGVGLYRTEIPFLIRDGFPGEDEQAHIYQQVLQSFAPRPVTFRTLDIGGDKALPYFPVIEANPFLGWRGIRIMLDHPEIFLTQIRAILKSNIYGNNLRLMLPMISDISEVDESLTLIHKAHRELNAEGNDVPFPLIGLTIEVPSAIFQMHAFCQRVDFFSIGSNDLTQYLLAVDRNNRQVAGLYNCLHPSVLHSIHHIISIAHQHNKPVSACGEMAGDPASALLLTGMGIDTLSMSVGSLLKVKWAIRSFTLEQTSELAEKALAMENVTDIRALVNQALDNAGLGELIRVDSIEP